MATRDDPAGRGKPRLGAESLARAPLQRKTLDQKPPAGVGYYLHLLRTYQSLGPSVERGVFERPEFLMRLQVRVALLFLCLTASAQTAKISFDTQPVISTRADEARSVFAADLDGDGDLDVLSAAAVTTCWVPALGPWGQALLFLVLAGSAARLHPVLSDLSARALARGGE